MRYTVTWQPAQKQKLARIWLDSPNRRDVTAAANRIETLLAESPATEGDDFYGDRILIDRPLGVIYSISEPDRLVEVFRVWHEAWIGEEE